MISPFVRQRTKRLPEQTCVKILLALCVAGFISLPMTSTGLCAITVSPARLWCTVRDGQYLSPLLIRNTGETDIRIKAWAGKGGHDLDGMPVIKERFRADEQGPVLRLSPAEFLVKPGRSVRVRGRVDVPTGFSGGFYPVIVFELYTSRQTKGIVSATRLIVPALLTVPGNLETGAGIESIRVLQGEPGGPVTVEMIASNTGNVHYRTEGKILIRSRGEEVAGLFLPQRTILPGCQRRIVTRWRPDELADGLYELQVSLVNGTRPLTYRETAFNVIRPYELAVHRGQILEFSAVGGQPGKLRAVIANTGNVPASPECRLEILGETMTGSRDGEGVLCKNRLLSPEPVYQVVRELQTMTPGETREVVFAVPPDLEPGTYNARLLLQGSGLMAEAETELDLFVSLVRND